MFWFVILSIVGLFCGGALALGGTGFWLWLFALSGEVSTIFIVASIILDNYIEPDEMVTKVINVIGIAFWLIALKLLFSDVERSVGLVLSLIVLAGLFIAPYFIVASLDAVFADSKVLIVLVGIAKILSSILLYIEKFTCLDNAQTYNEIPEKLIAYFVIVSLLALLSFILVILIPAVCAIGNLEKQRQMQKEQWQKQKIIQKESKRKQIKEEYSYQLISAVEENNSKTVAALIEKGADVNYKDFSGKVPLRIAMEKNNKNMISLLLEKGANIECKDNNGCTLLQSAVENGNLDMASFLLEKGAFINCRDSLGQTPLLMALRYNNKNMISLLLEKGAAINIFDSNSKSMLDFAIENEDVDLVSLLLEKGAEIGDSDSSLKTALDFAIKNDNEDLLSCLAEKAAREDVQCEDKPILFFAIENDYKKLVELLIEKGVHKKSRYSSDIHKNMTPLHFAVSWRKKDIVLLLLKNKVNVDEGAKSENQHYSPLYEAVVNNDKEIASILIENGANLNYDNGRGNTALMWTCLIEDKDMASFLIKKGADVNYIVYFTPSNEYKADLIKEGIDKKYLDYLKSGTVTPLSRSIDSNKEEMVSFLIENGADVNLAVSINNEEYSYTMLQKAIYNGNKKIVSLVLDAGAKINDNYQNRGTALITAVDTQNYDSEIVSLLIERGADVNLESAFNSHTPLTFAVAQNNKDAALLLLKNGADPNKRSINFGTPLGIAFKAVNKEMCSLLLENGANSDDALCISASMPNTEVAQFFLDRGANVNCESYNALTPLQCAVIAGTKEMVLFLISNGADVNYEISRPSEKNAARTPLETAIETGSAEMVSLLITYGADVNHKCKNGNTPLLFAARHQRTELVPILKDAGAVSNTAGKSAQTTATAATKSANSNSSDNSADFNAALVALSKIIAKNGAEIFAPENSQKLKALVSDLIPQENEIAPKLKQALSCDFAQIILDATDKSDKKKENAFKKSGANIAAETNLEKSAAVSIVKLVALSLDWNLENLNLE